MSSAARFFTSQAMLIWHPGQLSGIIPLHSMSVRQQKPKKAAVNSRESDRHLAEIRELSTGGKLAVERMPSMESFTIGFFLPVGAGHETQKDSGISHFIEHMVFKGSKKRSAKAIVKTIERVGGIINASTGREVTYFYVRIAAKRLGLALDVLSDLVFNPELDPDSLEKEKGVILEEIHMNEDDPGQSLYDKFLIAVHGKTAYGRPILGSVENVYSFNRKKISTHHQLHYNPHHLSASIAGGIDPDAVQKILEQRIGPFKRKAPAKIGTGKAPIFKRKVSVYAKDMEQSAMMIGFPSASIRSPDRYAYSLLDAILAGGMMSRLFQEIREKRGLVYSIDSTHQPYSKGGLFTIEAGMHEENILEVLYLCLRELRRLADFGPGKQELRDVKLFLRGHWALGLESTSARMIRNAMSTLFFDRLMRHDEIVKKLEAVTADAIAKAAMVAFEDEGPAVGVISRFDDGNKIGEIKKQIIEIRDRKGVANNNRRGKKLISRRK